MNNDSKYFIRLEDQSVEYPKEIFLQEFHKIQYFVFEQDKKWRATEVKTGFRISDFCDTKEEAIASAEMVITEHGINTTKQSIKIALGMIKNGYSYNTETKEWVKPQE